MAATRLRCLLQVRSLLDMDTLYTVLLLVGVVALLALLFLIYCGLLHTVVIKVVDSPYPSFLACYKFSTGPYENCSSLFGEVSKLAPGKRLIGLYYDDPGKVQQVAFNRVSSRPLCT